MEPELNEEGLRVRLNRGVGRLVDSASITADDVGSLQLNGLPTYFFPAYR